MAKTPETGDQSGSALSLKNNEITQIPLTRKTTQQALEIMLDTIRHAKEDLELRVEQRTAELERSNQALKKEIAERKQVEEELQIINKELDAFARTVSHDLRAPLRQIGGYAALFETKMGHHLDDEGRRYLLAIENGVRTMGKLVDDLLKYSRQGRGPISKVKVNVAGLVSEIQPLFAKETTGRTIEWDIQALPTVYADPSMLKIILTNLISNAVKFTGQRDKPRLQVGSFLDEREDAIFMEDIVFVKDNGVGFDMAHADKLFLVFQRLHSTDEFEGTGIGLASVRRLVERHGGRVWAEAAPGEGATFYFSLPRMQQN